MMERSCAKDVRNGNESHAIRIRTMRPSCMRDVRAKHEPNALRIRVPGMES